MPMVAIAAESKSPLVSCLTVTKGTEERMAGLAIAIKCFQRQSHAPCEMVIVVDSRDNTALQRVQALVAGTGDSRIRIVGGAIGTKLGGLRNLSIAEAEGEYFCQWDDDDLHHPRRIAEQLASVQAGKAQAVLLEDVMQYFPLTQRLWWTNWHATEVGGHPGTLLCHRDCVVSYPESGPIADRGEDTAAARQIKDAGALVTLPDKPFLYVYVSNGRNTYEVAHHEMLASRLAVSLGRLKRRREDLDNELAVFDASLGSAQLFAPNSPDPAWKRATEART